MEKGRSKTQSGKCLSKCSLDIFRQKQWFDLDMLTELYHTPIVGNVGDIVAPGRVRVVVKPELRISG
jgi:hypothetical protein